MSFGGVPHAVHSHLLFGPTLLLVWLLLVLLSINFGCEPNFSLRTVCMPWFDFRIELVSNSGWKYLNLIFGWVAGYVFTVLWLYRAIKRHSFLLAAALVAHLDAPALVDLLQLDGGASVQLDPLYWVLGELQFLVALFGLGARHRCRGVLRRGCCCGLLQRSTCQAHGLTQYQRSD